ncbi:hypothetical protein [Endozoicomonas sp. 8E]|uniref:hypothetical protein n=1 Tax=Endozoicomonas sp. 8E TaxID=3035692 RepID=UPI0029391A20|nr:hypothetical protein [Endozoicomonas sp. 8E]WOG28318.1 TGF-beta family protein [Endozoicomonas sp. 8E]
MADPVPTLIDTNATEPTIDIESFSQLVNDKSADEVLELAEKYNVPIYEGKISLDAMTNNFSLETTPYDMSLDSHDDKTDEPQGPDRERRSTNGNKECHLEDLRFDVSKFNFLKGDIRKFYSANVINIKQAVGSCSNIDSLKNAKQHTIAKQKLYEQNYPVQPARCVATSFKKRAFVVMGSQPNMYVIVLDKFVATRAGCR